jgi:hypothetical protein
MPPDTSGVARGLAPAGSDAHVVTPKPAKPVNLASFHFPLDPPRTAAINGRLLVAAQNDFAARLKWSVTPKFRDANHPPAVRIKGPLAIFASPGSTIQLQAEISDPDHDSVSVTWWQYNDAGTYPNDITFSDQTALTTTFRVSDDAKSGQTIDVILEGNRQWNASIVAISTSGCDRAISHRLSLRRTYRQLVSKHEAPLI